MSTIDTKYELGTDNVVKRVTWDNGDGKVIAELNANGDDYTYISDLAGDDEPVVSPKALSLADCALSAYVHLGLIPPHNFEPINCPNQH